MHRFDESVITGAKTAYRIRACLGNLRLRDWNRLPIDSDKPIEILKSDVNDLFDIRIHFSSLF